MIRPLHAPSIALVLLASTAAAPALAAAPPAADALAACLGADPSP